MTRTHDFNVIDSTNGDKLLHIAIKGKSDLGLIMALIQKGVSLDAPDRVGDTPLSLAIEANSAPVIRALTDAGVRVPLRFLIRKALNPTQAVSTGGFLGTG